MNGFRMLAAASLVAAMPFAGAANTQAIAQESDTPSSACASIPQRAFDFWAGEWNVVDETGAVVGTSSVTVEEGGCLIVERWRSSGGVTGQSYNYFDTTRREWRQVWVSPSAIIDLSGQPTDDGRGMRMFGSLVHPDGSTRPMTARWTMDDKGRVQQEFRLYDDVDDEFALWFAGTYMPAD